MRYYENSIPEIGQIVYCNTARIAPTCIHVELLEYNNMPGIVIIADATIRKKRKSHCLMKLNKNYPLVIKNINHENKLELSFRYVDKNDKKPFLDYISKYQKALRVFKYFLLFIERNFSDETYLSYAEKIIWKVEKKKLYDYIVSYYLNKNKLELFDITKEEKEFFDKALFKFFGKLEINTKYLFSVRNPNYEGVNKIIEIFGKVKDKFNTDILVNTIPEYYINIKGESEKDNNNIIENIESYLVSLIKGNNCIYQKNNIITNHNI